MHPVDLSGGPPPGPVSVGRDQRLDMFRGLALLMIFINHVPGTIYEHATSRNFGFSDAAEAFVLMSGIAAGLAYSKHFRAGPSWPAIARVWARARQLYLVHLSISLVALAIFAGAALWFGLPELLNEINIAPIFEEPLLAMVGLPLLGHQLGYFNILPLYFVLLLATPALLMLGMRWPMGLLALSVTLWAAAGQFRLNLPSFPVSGGWFFNPLSWQLIFVVGLLSGVAMREGRSLVAHSPRLFWAAAGSLVLVFLWVRIDAVGDVGRTVLGWLSDLGAPFYVVWFDKTFLPLPRLLHILALAYVVSAIPAVRLFAEGRYARPLTLLGRHGLPVFAVGSVISIALQAVKAAIVSDPFIDGVLLASGIGALLVLAYILEHTKVVSRRISIEHTSAEAAALVEYSTEKIRG
jgi:hypothetical protein